MKTVPLKAVFSIGGMYGGGSERQMISLLKSIDREKIEPLLYLVDRAGPLLDEVPKDVLITSFEERYRGPRSPRLLMHRRRAADMSRFLQECGAGVCYDRTFLMTLIAAEAAQRVGVPNVSTIVTDPSLGFAPVAGRFQWLKRRILRRLYNQSTRVLANSSGSARNAELFYGLRSGLVETHHNGVDLKQIRSISARPVDDQWWNGSRNAQVFRIASAGRLNHEKGFHLLVDAIGQIRRSHPDVQIKLAILGEGPAHSMLSKQINDAELADSIHLVGFRRNLTAWFRSADLFVLPSLLEGMPNVVLEAMACETPVLASDCPSGPREILGDEHFGDLCAVGSTDALTDGIRKFLDDPDHGRSRVEAAAQHVEQTYSIQTAARRLEEILIAAAGS